MAAGKADRAAALMREVRMLAFSERFQGGKACSIEHRHSIRSFASLMVDEPVSACVDGSFATLCESEVRSAPTARPTLSLP